MVCARSIIVSLSCLRSLFLDKVTSIHADHEQHGPDGREYRKSTTSEGRSYTPPDAFLEHFRDQDRKLLNDRAHRATSEQKEIVVSNRK